MNSTSDRPLLESERRPRLVALDGAPHRYIIEAELDVSEETDAVQLVQLYWAVEGLQPLFIDLDDDHLFARFRRHAPSAEVAAWALADELRALPGAQLSRVAVRAANEAATELVLTNATDAAGFQTARRFAA